MRRPFTRLDGHAPVLIGAVRQRKLHWPGTGPTPPPSGEPRQRYSAQRTLDSRPFVAAASIFSALVIGGVVLALVALVVASAVRQGILIGLGSALVASGLAFILVEAFARTASRRQRTNTR